MAVNIDTVYQRVLAISNKEQRGYITPQEFNLFANQAQMDIFEQYFYDLNQFSRVNGNDTVYADMVSIVEEKIQIFEEYAGADITNVAIDINDTSNRTYILSAPPLSTIHRLDQLIVNNRNVEIVNNKNFNRFERYNQTNQAPLFKPSANRPIGTMYRSVSEPNFMQIPPGNNNCLIAFPHRPIRPSPVEYKLESLCSYFSLFCLSENGGSNNTILALNFCSTRSSKKSAPSI